MGFNDLLKMLIEKEGSDLFLTTGAPPSMKAFGRLSPLVDKKMPEGMVKKIAYQIMNEDQIKDFEKSPEMNLAIADPDIGRFRVNIFKQRGEVAIVARNIKTEIPSAASLGLPPILNDLIMQKNGIILFVGGGNYFGKSFTSDVLFFTAFLQFTFSLYRLFILLRF